MKTTSDKGSRRTQRFSKNGKVQIFRKPQKIDSSQEHQLGENPFKKDWRFKASPSTHQFRVKLDGDRNSYNVHTAPQNILMEVKNNNFLPYLLEGSYLRIHSEESSDFKQKVYRLKPRSHTLLIWILLNLDYGKDYMLLNKQYLMNSLGMSKGTLYKAEKELIGKGFIQNTDVQHHYWINAQYFFLGNRCHYATDCVETSDGQNIDIIKQSFYRRHKNLIDARTKEGDHLINK